jgi:hypothetical protein
MKPILATTLLLAAYTLTGIPATASTLPSLDFQKGQTIVAGGLADANFDYALTDRLSVGLSGAYVSAGIPPYSLGLSGTVGAIRVTYHVTHIYNLEVGASISGGYSSLSYPGPGGRGQSAGYWWQPVLNLALRHRAPFEQWATRFTLGPLLPIAQQAFVVSKWLLIPNFELGYRLDPTNEVTIGGNSLIGWRRIF